MGSQHLLEQREKSQPSKDQPRGYSQCYPWDRGHRWDLGVRRDREHRGNQELQRYQERPERATKDREEVAQLFLPQPGKKGTLGTLTVAPLAPG